MKTDMPTIEKLFFSYSEDHETWTLVEKSGCQILHKSNTFSCMMRM